MDLNPNLDEWILVRESLDYSQCIALLEQSQLKKRLSKLETINCIILLINGFDSELFIWDSNMNRFNLAEKFAMNQLNSLPFRKYLLKFAPIGSMYRRMFEFVQLEFHYGKTFSAYQIILEKILIEIMEKTLKVRNEFFSKEEKNLSDKNIRLILLESYLDSDVNGNLLLSLKNLYSIHCDIIADNNDHNDNDNDDDNDEKLLKSEIQRYRYYCRQILQAIHRRLFIPQKRIRSLTYTMLEYCMRPMFIMIESMLKNFSSISQLKFNEFLFDSKFHSDDQLFFTSYSLNEMFKFWSDFLFIDEQFKSLKLFQFESLDLLTEAIKCSFSFRKNFLFYNSKKLSINILETFRTKMSYYLKLYCKSNNNGNVDDDSFNVEVDFKEELNKFNEANFLKFSENKVKKFQSFELPLVTVYNIVEIVECALNDTFETISRPIIQEFLPQFRFHYLKLFNYYSNFFLIQNAQHIWLYTHYLFPDLKDLLMTAKHQNSFSNIEQLLNKIHQSLQDDPSEDNGLRLFQPHISTCFHPIKPDETDFDWIIRSFDLFYYLPSFENNETQLKGNGSNNLYNFWPITQMFNPKITELFNELFQFLIRLRYFQYLIGNDFILSYKFRQNDLEKNIYLFRFRLANLIFQFGRQIHYQLSGLIEKTLGSFNESTTIGDFFQAHQKFLEKLNQINQRMIKSDFVRNQFRTIAKFCHSNSMASNLTRKIIDEKNMSIWKNINKLDRVQQDDFSFQ